MDTVKKDRRELKSQCHQKKKRKKKDRRDPGANLRCLNKNLEGESPNG
jgi:hypothetical protein